MLHPRLTELEVHTETPQEGQRAHREHRQEWGWAQTPQREAKEGRATASLERVLRNSEIAGQRDKARQGQQAVTRAGAEELKTHRQAALSKVAGNCLAIKMVTKRFLVYGGNEREEGKQPNIDVSFHVALPGLLRVTLLAFPCALWIFSNLRS